MSCITNYEAVSDYFGHWLHRAQVSLLTGEIGQIIKLSHIVAALLPGAGLVRASLSRSPTDCDTCLRKLVPKRGWCG